MQLPRKKIGHEPVDVYRGTHAHKRTYAHHQLQHIYDIQGTELITVFIND